MWSLSPSARRRPDAVLRARLCLEGLEDRACPSAFVLSDADVGAALVAAASSTATAPVAAPVITSFQVASAGSANWFTFSGTVTGYLPGMTVTISSNLPDLQGVQVTVGANGSFSYTQQLRAGESGTATAVATDVYGQSSNVASVFVDVPLNYNRGSGRDL